MSTMILTGKFFDTYVDENGIRMGQKGCNNAKTNPVYIDYAYEVEYHEPVDIHALKQGDAIAAFVPCSSAADSKFHIVRVVYTNPDHNSVLVNWGGTSTVKNINELYKPTKNDITKHNKNCEDVLEMLNNGDKLMANLNEPEYNK